MAKNKIFKRNMVTFVVLVLFMATGLMAREKTEMIGKYKWYTEQNTFDEMVQISQKANKPILAVFSATWCGPCQHVKKNVFKTDEFKKVADEAVLLYIEQTTKEGAVYNKKYKINSFPTFKVFSTKGVMLDTGHPKRTVDGFTQWVKDVKAGNNFYEMSQKLEKNPADRETLVKITGKMGYREGQKKIDYLKRAIKLNTDFNDPLSQQAYEKLGSLLVSNIPRKKGKKQTDYFNANRQLFGDIVNAYYPDKFKHQLKGSSGLSTILNWFNRDKKFDRSLSFFDDFLKEKEGKPSMEKDLGLVTTAVSSYLGAGKVEEAEKWAMQVYQAGKENEKLSKGPGFAYYFSNLFNTVVKHFGEKEQIKEAEKYAGILYDEMDRMGHKRPAEYMMIENASKYGILPARTLETIDEKLKTSKGGNTVNNITNKAKVLAKMGKREAARKQLLDLYENADFFKSLKEKEVPQVLNSIAWTMVELKMVDQKSLKIAKKAVELNDSGNVMDTLACVYAELGKFNEAIKVESEAVKKLSSEGQKQEFLERIKDWKAKLTSQ